MAHTGSRRRGDKLTRCRLGLWFVGLGTVSVLAGDADYSIQPVPFVDTEIVGGFWGPRLETNRRVTVWSNLKKCEETGRLANFAKTGGRLNGGFDGIFFNDSDIFKVIEGASCTLARHPDPKLEAYLDALIDDVAAAQEDDGYLYTARRMNDPNCDYRGKEKRWADLSSGREPYNAGHFGAHYQQAGTDDRLRSTARRLGHARPCWPRCRAGRGRCPCHSV